MDWMTQPGTTETVEPQQSRSGPFFRVRRHVDGACSEACDFNRGACLMSWRHPAGTVPWDRRCRNGDVYRLTPAPREALP